MSMCRQNNSDCMTQGKGASSETALPLLESMLMESIQALQPEAKLEAEDVASASRLIYDSMSTAGRVYHAMQHVFEISEDMKDPILILSALFHDVIYFSIDKEFSQEQAKLLEGVVVSGTSPLTLETDFEEDLMAKIVALYGFSPGEEIPKLGTNEFLSAIIGIRVLSKWLEFSQLMAVATCIEATIPFRPVIDGKTPMDRLYDRLKTVCPQESEEWLETTVRNAATTANFDLCSFDSNNRDFFLDSSWKLIPEGRPALMREDCPLIEWMQEMNALMGRTNFLKGAIPRIFQSFRQVPSDEAMAEKRRKTEENLDFVLEYGKVRQLQAMVLVGVVEAMGEDPASFPLRSCLALDVPTLSEGENLTPIEKEVRDLLVVGRRAAFAWDPAASPLAAYLFDSLRMQGVNEALEIGKNQKPGSHDLLRYLPKSVVVTVTSRLGTVFTDRADLLSALPEKLGIMAQ